MTLDRAREIIQTRLQPGGGEPRNAGRPRPGEVQRERGRGVVGGLIREFDLEQAFGLKPGTPFHRVGR